MVRQKEYGKRMEDKSRWFKGAYYVEKYAILWIPLTAIISALGFGWVTPKMQINQISATVKSKIDTLQQEINVSNKRQDSIVLVHQDISKELKLLLRLGCVDPRISAHDKLLVGLDCAELAK